MVRPKYAVRHGRKSTSKALSPLDLHTCGEIHKQYHIEKFTQRKIPLIYTGKLNKLSIYSCVTFVLHRLWMSTIFHDSLRVLASPPAAPPNCRLF